MSKVVPKWYKSCMCNEEINGYTFLDKIDLKPFLIKRENEDIYEAMEDIEEKYIDEYEYDYIFNAISDYDFCDYINNRYGINSIREETIYRINYNFGKE